MSTEKQPSRLRDLAEKGGYDVLRYDPRNIVVEPNHNPRNFDTPEMQERVEEIKRSIQASGFWDQEPLKLRFESAEYSDSGVLMAPARGILVDGETRLRAVLRAIDEGTEILSVPVMSVKGANEKQRLLIALGSNTGRRLNEVESGTAFHRLTGFGMSPQEIATHLSVTVGYVNTCLALFDSPQAVQQLVAEKKVTPARAVSEVKTRGSKAAETLTKEVSDAKAAGKKGPVKRVKTLPRPAAPKIALLPRQERQQTAAEWVLRCFGSLEATSLPQRGIRHLEEAAEAAHAAGVPLGMAHQMLDYVWERPKGVLSQEIGGSGLTLLALAAAAALDADTCEQAELDRVLAKSDDHFKERNAVKNDAGFLAVGEVA